MERWTGPRSFGFSRPQLLEEVVDTFGPFNEWTKFFSPSVIGIMSIKGPIPNSIITGHFRESFHDRIPFAHYLLMTVLPETTSLIGRH